MLDIFSQQQFYSAHMCCLTLNQPTVIAALQSYGPALSLKPGKIAILDPRTSGLRTMALVQSTLFCNVTVAAGRIISKLKYFNHLIFCLDPPLAVPVPFSE